MTTATNSAIPPLSQSKQGLLACPHLYRDIEINGIEQPENEPQQRGQEVHDVIATYVEHLVETKQSSDEAFYEELISNHAVLLHESYQIMRNMRTALVIDPDRVLGVEMYLALDKKMQPVVMDSKPRTAGHRSEQVEVEGTLDYVQLVGETEAEIFDWKSYFNAIDADTFQSRLYPLLLFKHYPFLEKIRFVLRFVRYGTLARDVTFTRENLPELEVEARNERRRQLRMHRADEVSEDAGEDVALAWEGEKYLSARPGNHCAWCPKMSASIRAQFAAQTTGLAHAVDQSTVCPLTKINPWVQQSPEDRVRYAVFMDQARKENANILREFVQANGPITITDANGQPYTAGYDLTTSEKFPVQDTVAMLEGWRNETGEDLLPKVYVGSTELKPLLKTKKRALLNDRMQAVTLPVVKTKWHIGKNDDDEADQF